MIDSGTTLDRIVSNACRLYSLPAVAMQVLELTESSKVDTRALKQCIETDPALTGKILRVVNSSLYGLSREVSDLNQALALLGTKPLKLLVLGFSLPAGLFEGIVGDVLLRYWRHTLVKAVSAREIAETFWRRAGDEPFIAGLLQDLGALLLIQELGEPYVRFLEEVVGHSAEIADLERESIGFEHTQLTAHLLRHWKLPTLLVNSVCLSTPPSSDDAPSTLVSQILRLAELVARLLADGQADALPKLLEEGHAACGIGRPAVEELVAGLEEKVKQLADTLNVDLAGGTDYGQLLREAHDRLVNVAEEVAGDLTASSAGTGGRNGPMADVLSSLARAAANASEARPAAETESPPSSHDTPTSEEHTTQAPSTEMPTAATSVAPVRLAAYVATAAAACRQARCPMSLMLVEMNDPESLALSLGRQGFLEVYSQIGQACCDIDHLQRACMPHGQTGFLVILSDCERQSAVRLGQSLIQTVRSRCTVGGQPVGVSVGVASASLPPVNFDPKVMLESADRCLRGARSSGGAMVKSIEIY